jgi:hypothetical protein
VSEIVYAVGTNTYYYIMGNSLCAPELEYRAGAGSSAYPEKPSSTAIFGPSRMHWRDARKPPAFLFGDPLCAELLIRVSFHGSPISGERTLAAARSRGLKKLGNDRCGLPNRRFREERPANISDKLPCRMPRNRPGGRIRVFQGTLHYPLAYMNGMNVYSESEF